MTQLKNQDPTSPLDTNQFTSQLVQFAGVEQQISMNTNLEKMIAMQTTSQLTAAAHESAGIAAGTWSTTCSRAPRP